MGNGVQSGKGDDTHLATRSLRAGAPVLICPVPRATTKSAMIVFSVSPDRWETITPQPSLCASWALHCIQKRSVYHLYSTQRAVIRTPVHSR